MTNYTRHKRFFPGDKVILTQIPYSPYRCRLKGIVTDCNHPVYTVRVEMCDTVNKVYQVYNHTLELCSYDDWNGIIEQW